MINEHLEYLNIVDENDNIIGVDTRNNIYDSGTSNFRVVHALIFLDNKLIVPIRSSSKQYFPNCYDFSVGGHVQAGESYDEAINREIKEELRYQYYKNRET